MANKKAATKRPKMQIKYSSNNNDTRLKAQCERLLAALKVHPVDTFFAREKLNILMPAARIKELKLIGHKIAKTSIRLCDSEGREHRGIARYSLISLAKRG